MLLLQIYQVQNDEYFWLDGDQQDLNVGDNIKKNTPQQAMNWFFDTNPEACRKMPVLLLMNS